MKVFWYKCGLFSWIRYKRPKMVPAMVGCLPLAEKGRSIRSATLPGQPAHHPAPALSQPIHLRAMPSFQVSWEFSSSHNPWCSSHPTTSAGLGTNCYHLLLCGIQCSGWQRLLYDSLKQMTMQIFMSFPSPGSGTRCQPTHFFSQTEETNICRIIGHLTPARVFSNESFPALHRGILIFRETVTIPQFSHLSKSFIKTSWNQQVWAENPRH